MKQSDQIKLEMAARSLDTIRVANPTTDDYVLDWNKSASGNIPPQKFTIPNKNKDVGFGKGMLDVPRYIADRYKDQMLAKLIYDEHEIALEKLKKEYRREEMEQMEQRYAPKLNDTKMIKKYLPQIWVGLVRRQEIVLPQEFEVEEQARGDSESDRLLKEMGLEDKQIDQIKKDFVNAISE